MHEQNDERSTIFRKAPPTIWSGSTTIRPMPWPSTRWRRSPSWWSRRKSYSGPIFRSWRRRPPRRVYARSAYSVPGLAGNRAR